MKRFLFLGALLVLAASATAATLAAQKPTATTAAPTKVTICHKTDSDDNPWRRIVISSRAVSKPSSAAGKTFYGHLRHIGDAIVIGTAACPSASATPAPSTTAPARITICHKTGSSSNPYRRITISSRGVTNPNSQSGRVLRGHARHAGDILMPGATACPSGTPTGGEVGLSATLQPVQYASGSGTASVTIRLGRNELCHTLTVTGLTDVTEAHIHRVSTQAIVVPLSTPTSGSSNGCATVERDLLREIQTTPGAFYVNVHTATYPNGQVQGALTR